MNKAKMNKKLILLGLIFIIILSFSRLALASSSEENEEDTEKEELYEDKKRKSGYPFLNRTDHHRYITGYPDGSVRPENKISREETAVIIYRLLHPGYRKYPNVSIRKFNDISEDNWSIEYIKVMMKNNIMKGYKDGSFRPKSNITRGELLSILGKLLGQNKSTVNRFNDVANHWARDAINTGADKKWINGYEDGSFKPDKEVTRAEFVAIMNGALGRHIGKDDINKEYIYKNIKKYKDLDEDKWYYLPMVEALNSHEYRKLPNGKEVWNKVIETELIK